LSPRPDVSEQRKKEIVEAAIRVFSRMGLHQARMDDIVEESGLSKGTLYWYFKGKDEIIIAILDNMFAAELGILHLPSDPELSASQRIEAYIQRTRDDVTDMLRLLPLTYEFYALAFRNQAIREMLTQYLNAYMQALVPVIQQGIDTGEFRPVNATDAAIALGAMFEGVLLLWMYDPELVDLTHHFETSTDLFLQGLKARQS